MTFAEYIMATVNGDEAGPNKTEKVTWNCVNLS
jgi:hypothetical protein